MQLHIKPLSANAAFKGRKFKTAAYKNYEKALMMLLHLIMRYLKDH